MTPNRKRDIHEWHTAATADIRDVEPAVIDAGRDHCVMVLPELMAEIDRLSRDLDEATHVIERLCDAAGQTLHGNPEPLAGAVDLAVRFVSAGPAPVDVLRAVEQDEIEVRSWQGGQQVTRTDGTVIAWHRPTGIAMVVTSERSQHANRQLAVSRLKILLAEATTAWRER